MTPHTLALALGVALAALLGFLVGRAWRHGTLAKERRLSDGRARRQATLHSRDVAALMAERHRLVEITVNFPEVVNRMGAARSTSALCRITVRAAVDLLQARRVGLFLVRGNPPRFDLEVLTGMPRPDREVSFGLGEGRLGTLAELIGVRGAADLVRAPSRTTAADELFAPDLGVAVRRHGRIHAFIAADGLKVDDPTTRRVLQMLADLHSVSAESLKLLHHERAKAEIDGLTGLFNRHHLDRRLVEEVARAETVGTRLAAFLFDIDNFKSYNDTHGHQAGDECLRWVASLTRGVTRGSDVVCRYGGEEFLVILLGAGREEAWHHAERIRATLAAADIPHARSQPLGCISVSGGVAAFPDDARDAPSLVALADHALYAAKDSGRNRICLAFDLREARARGGGAGPAESTSATTARAALRGTDPVLTPLPRDVARVLRAAGLSAEVRTLPGGVTRPDSGGSGNIDGT